MLFVFLIIFEMAFPHWGHPIPTIQSQYNVTAEGPSCLLLKHRSLERQKVFRELQHLMELDWTDPVARFMAEDELTQNKLFIDQNIWEDEIVKVSFQSQITPEMQAAISESGWEALMISVKGPGMTWTSHPNQLPEELNIQYVPGTQTVQGQYWIYRHNWCQSGEKPPSVRWLGARESVENFVNSAEVQSELQSILEDRSF